MFFFWCYAEFQQRSNERLLVLPQIRSSSIHGVESTFCPNGVKLFKNHQNLDWIVLFQTWPGSFHGVEEPFRLDVMQPFRKHWSWWQGRVSKIPCHDPAYFAALNYVFVLMLCRFSTALKWTAGRAPPNTNQLNLRCWVNFSSGWHEVFQKHSNLRLVVLPQTRPGSLHGVEEPFLWMLCSHFNNFQVHRWTALPNIPCHGQIHFTSVNMGIVLMLCRLSTTFKWTVGRAPPNTVQLISRCWVNFSSGWHEAF